MSQHVYPVGRIQETSSDFVHLWTSSSLNEIAPAVCRGQPKVARVKSEHLPIDRLYEAAQGLGLEGADVEHLRHCLDCREILRIMTRHSKERLRSERKIPSVLVENVPTHVSILRLWPYGRGMEMGAADRNHIFECERCIGILAICRGAMSLQDSIQTLRAHGLEVE